MSARFLLFLAILSFGGCTTPAPVSVATGRTLATDPRLPAEEIARLCSPRQWNQYGLQEFRAFVILECSIRRDGSVDVGKARTSFPDASWVSLAEGYARQVELLEVANPGSNIPPAGEIFVIFFEENLSGKVVLTYAHQRDRTARTYETAKFIRTDTY